MQTSLEFKLGENLREVSTDLVPLSFSFSFCHLGPSLVNTSLGGDICHDSELEIKELKVLLESVNPQNRIFKTHIRRYTREARICQTTYYGTLNLLYFKGHQNSLSIRAKQAVLGLS